MERKHVGDECGAWDEATGGAGAEDYRDLGCGVGVSMRDCHEIKLSFSDGCGMGAGAPGGAKEGASGGRGRGCGDDWPGDGRTAVDEAWFGGDWLMFHGMDDDCDDDCDCDDDDAGWLDDEDDGCDCPHDGRAKGSPRKALGRLGEEAAVRYLRLKGYRVIARNWTCPAGEADIIAYDGDTLVFVEVKTRSSLRAGLPETSVTPEKRARYEKIAAWYLSSHDAPESEVRFDVMGILVCRDDRALLRHHQNAFGIGEC